MIWGTLMVIPIEESLIYVRPLYLRGAGSNIPALTRVVVAHQDRVIMDNTLEEALAQLFGGAHPPTPTTTTTTTAAPQAPAGAAGTPPAPMNTELAALAAEARAHYEKATAAQRAGDWATYGEELKRLGDVLQKMKR